MARGVATEDTSFTDFSITPGSFMSKIKKKSPIIQPIIVVNQQYLLKLSPVMEEFLFYHRA